MRKKLRKHLLIIIVVLYLVLPWDLLPDYLGAIGFSDDITIFLLAMLVKYLKNKKGKGEKLK